MLDDASLLTFLFRAAVSNVIAIRHMRLFKFILSKIEKYSVSQLS